MAGLQQQLTLTHFDMEQGPGEPVRPESLLRAEKLKTAALMYGNLSTLDFVKNIVKYF